MDTMIDIRMHEKLGTVGRFKRNRNDPTTCVFAK